ncbi:MAG: DUF1320 domain-containing protein [Ahrensia sp.]|nr:DUF1320 domain-containing protein [Ahrensia sp.]
MSKLIAIDDLIALIGLTELSQVAGTGSHNTEGGRALDEAQINAAANFADDMIKSYVAARFPIIHTLTPASTPDMLKGYASDIARYRLRLRSGNRNTTTDEVETRYRDAVAWLKDVSRGIVNLDFHDVDGGATNAGADTHQTGTVRAIIPDGRAAAVLDGY